MTAAEQLARSPGRSTWVHPAVPVLAALGLTRSATQLSPARVHAYAHDRSSEPSAVALAYSWLRHACEGLPCCRIPKGS